MNNLWASRLAAGAVAGLLVIASARLGFAQKLVIVGQAGAVDQKAAAAPAAENAEALQKISRKLLSPADIQADKKPLAKFAEDLAKQYEIPIRLDEPALKAAGVAINAPVTAEIKKGSLGQALSKVLKEHKLRWELRDSEVVITGAAKVAAPAANVANAAITGTFTIAVEAAPAEAPKVDPEMLQKISRKMLAAADIQADKQPLAKFAADLAKKYEIPLRVDEQALKAANIALDLPVTAEIKKGTLGQALSKVLKDHKLRWEMRDTEVVITGLAKAAPANPPVLAGGGGGGVGWVFANNGAVAVPAQAPPVEQPKVDPEMLQKISRKMLAAADIQAEKQPLATFVRDVAKKYDVPIRIDVKTIQAVGLKPDLLITAEIKKGTFSQAFNTILKKEGLRWELRDTEVVVTSIAKPAAPVVNKQQAAQARALAQAQAQEQALQQQEKQFVPQFRILWKAELHFIRNVCQPNDDQLAKLNAAGRLVAEQASSQMVRGRNGGRRLVEGRPNVVKLVSTEPRAIIQEAILPLVEANLTAEQVARYKQELEQSRLERRQMVIDNLVAKLDRDLQLSVEQRDKIAGTLANDWDVAWTASTQALMNLDNAFPVIPDPLVIPALNERQQKIWRGIPKQNINYFGGFGIMGNQIDEAVWDDDDSAGASDKVDANDEAQPVRVN